MQNLFQTHPYSTKVGTLIERATDSGKLAIDWALILEICDALCETDEGPKEAIRAIRKRLTASPGKDHLSIWYALVLIEACLKNCGKRFQTQIANRDFLHDLIKVLLPKNNPPIQLQTKVLFMIKTWVDCSWDVPGRRDLEKVYAALRRKGVQFPTSADCKSLPPPIMNIKRNQNTQISRSTKLTSTFRRLTGSTTSASSSSSSLSTGPGESRVFGSGDSRFKSSSGNHHHQHHHQAHNYQHHQRLPPHHQHQSGGLQIQPFSHHSSTNRVIGSVMPDGSQISELVATCNRGHTASSGHVPHQVQLVAVNGGYTLVERSDGGNQSRSMSRQASGQQCLSITGSAPSAINNLPDQTLVDEEGTVRRLSSLQREKLTQDLAVVQTNLHILNDMLTELQPDSISADDLELLQQLNETCRMMQQRVAEFLAQVADDAVTLTLLQLNDELNGAFQRYERFERYRLRAMRALVANRSETVVENEAQVHNQLAITQSGHSSSSPCHHNHRRQQQQQQRAITSETVPLAITGPGFMRCDENGVLEDGDDDDEDDDDDELLDAVAEHTQLQSSQHAATTNANLPASADLIEVWNDRRFMTPQANKGQQTVGSVFSQTNVANATALASLRLDGGFLNNISVPSSDHDIGPIQHMFGSNILSSDQTRASSNRIPVSILDPLTPTPALPTTITLPGVKAKHHHDKQDTNSRQLEETLSLFDT